MTKQSNDAKVRILKYLKRFGPCSIKQCADLLGLKYNLVNNYMHTLERQRKVFKITRGMYDYIKS